MFADSLATFANSQGTCFWKPVSSANRNQNLVQLVLHSAVICNIFVEFHDIRHL